MSGAAYLNNGGGDLFAHQRQMVVFRPHSRRRCADGADDRAIVIADRRADAAQA